MLQKRTIRYVEHTTCCHFKANDTADISESGHLKIQRDGKLLLAVKLDEKHAFEYTSSQTHPRKGAYRGCFHFWPGKNGEGMVGFIAFKKKTSTGADDDDVEIFIATATPTEERHRNPLRALLNRLRTWRAAAERPLPAALR